MICVKKLTGLTACMAMVAVCQAGPLEHYMQQELEKRYAPTIAKSIRAETFKQLIDHNKPEPGFFSQRYYVDESFSENAESPVFFYICGESACTERALMGAIRVYAKEHHAKLVALEHRYYGKSLPMSSFSKEDLRYLTTEQALDDLAYFQRRMKNNNNWTGKWIAFGGSYPGSLSAWYRLKFPYLVAGALASSAPVMAKENFIEYDAHVAKVLPDSCLEKVRDVVRQTENAMAHSSDMQTIKAKFAADEVRDDVDFLYLLADVAAASVQYGMQDSFCQALDAYPQAMDGYAVFTQSLLQLYGVTAVQLTAQGAISDNIADYDEDANMRQWYYQSCTEFGYWQNAHPKKEKSSRSGLINPDYHQNICQRLFGLSASPATATINNTYYYPLMNEAVSNIYFTNGENDPWSNLSLADKNGNTQNRQLSYDLIEGAAHCDDLRKPTQSDSRALEHVRKRMNRLLSNWLRS